MEFSVVEIGYDQNQVDCCLEDLGEQLARLAARADAAAEANAELAQVRAEAARLRSLLTGPSAAYGTSPDARRMLALAEREAAEIVARARADLAAAREEARQVRDRVYAEAVQARRDFEAALHARRVRAEQVDEILSGVTVVRVPHRPGSGEEREQPAACAGAPSPAAVDKRSTAQAR